MTLNAANTFHPICGAVCTLHVFHDDHHHHHNSHFISIAIPSILARIRHTYAAYRMLHIVRVGLVFFSIFFCYHSALSTSPVNRSTFNIVQRRGAFIFTLPWTDGATGDSERSNRGPTNTVMFQLKTWNNFKMGERENIINILNISFAHLHTCTALRTLWLIEWSAHTHTHVARFFFHSLDFGLLSAIGRSQSQPFKLETHFIIWCVFRTMMLMYCTRIIVLESVCCAERERERERSAYTVSIRRRVRGVINRLASTHDVRVEYRGSVWANERDKQWTFHQFHDVYELSLVV